MLTQPDYIIEMLNVSKIYDNGVTGLKDVTLRIKRNEFIFLVGSSGAGKSTFIKSLLKEVDVNQGKIRVDGDVITRYHRRQVPYLRRKIGVVFQDFRLLPNKTIEENVAFALEITGTPQRTIKKQVTKVLNIVGLLSKRKDYPNNLSGGEQQRVSIARAIINNPSILIADEPTGNLDPETSWEIMKILHGINRRGTTVLMATHDKNIVDAMRKRVIVLKHGQVIRDDERGVYGNEL